MESTNVARFADELKVPAEVLLEQLRAAGVNKSSPNDALTEADKEQLLAALRRSHGGEDAPKKKITLTRKQTSEIKQADATGKARTIQVEVRKKRVFVKRDTGDAEPRSMPAPAEAEAPAQSAVDLEQQRIREEEESRQRELLERQAPSCARSRNGSSRSACVRSRRPPRLSAARKRRDSARRRPKRSSPILKVKARGPRPMRKRWSRRTRRAKPRKRRRSRPRRAGRSRTRSPRSID